MTITYCFMESPVGSLGIAAEEDGLCALQTADSFHRYLNDIERPLEDNKNPILLRAKSQLQEYFDGTRQDFDLPLSWQGTNFQNQVWSALCQIPFGEIRSYQEQAKFIGNPKAVRAVGAANGKNPIAIVVPCHRVIGSNGSLTGYAGGLAMKRFLLDLEGYTP